MTENDPIPNHTLEQLLPCMTKDGRKKAQVAAKTLGEDDLLEQGWYNCPTPDDYQFVTPDYVWIAYREEDADPAMFALATRMLHADGVENYIEQWLMMEAESAEEPLTFNKSLTKLVPLRSKKVA